MEEWLMATIGTDPELFVGSASGELIAVCGKLGGTKGKPIDLGDGIGLQEDNVMLEYNIEPSRSPMDFAMAVTAGLATVTQYAQRKMGQDVVPLRGVAEYDVPGTQLVHPLAQRFGCSPDFDSHARGNAAPAVDPKRLRTANGAMRFAGGHVHMGYSNPHNVPDFVVASFADLFLGLPSIMDGDLQKQRRGMYGAPGRYRPTSYGIEYRVLSNYWIWETDTAYHIGNRALKLATAIETTAMDVIQRWYKETPWSDVQRAMATNDRNLAERLWYYLNDNLLGGKL
jgi:hypothetical protein